MRRQDGMVTHVDVLQMSIMLQLNNLGVRALVEYCKSTLTSVDVSDCIGLNDEVGLAMCLFSYILLWKQLPKICNA